MRGELIAPAHKRVLDLRPDDAASDLHTPTAFFFNVQPLYFCADQQGDFGAGKSSQIGSRSIVAYVSLDVQLIPANTSGVFPSDVICLWEAKALRRGDECGCKRSSVFDVCEG